MRPRTRRILYIIAAFIGILLLLDALLWWIDPYGIVTLWKDAGAMVDTAHAAPDGWRYTPGVHEFITYSVVIDTDGFRAVPESNQGDCQIAVLGDSVAYGMGSSVSFVNLLAPDIPAQVVNRALPGYSAANILALLDTLDADGYVWLIIQNDDEPFSTFAPHYHPLQPALVEYFSFRAQPVPTPRPIAWFTQPADQIMARGDVLSFAFAGAYLTEVAHERYGTTIIPPYTSFVSGVDYHPDPEGHRQIANAMRPYIVDFVGRTCED